MRDYYGTCKKCGKGRLYKKSPKGLDVDVLVCRYCLWEKVV